MRLEGYAKEKGYYVTKEGKCFSPKGNELNKDINKDGYMQFAIRVGKTTRKVMIHRLQAYQKYGEDLFNEGMVTRHLDGVHANNSWDNILIGTHSQNMMDIPKEKRLAKANHATSFWRKHDKSKVKEFHSKSRSYKKTMEEFNISSKGTLNFILTH